MMASAGQDGNTEQNIALSEAPLVEDSHIRQQHLEIQARVRKHLADNMTGVGNEDYKKYLNFELADQVDLLIQQDVKKLFWQNLVSLNTNKIKKQWKRPASNRSLSLLTTRKIRRSASI